MRSARGVRAALTLVIVAVGAAFAFWGLERKPPEDPKSKSSSEETPKMEPEVRARVARAIDWRKRGELRKAVETLVDVLLETPDDRFACLELGQCLARVGRDELAAGFFRIARELEPADAEERRARMLLREGARELALRFRARGLVLRGRLAEADALLRERADASAGARVYLIEHLVNTERASSAAAEVARLASELGSAHPDVRGWSAMVSRATGDANGAATTLRALIGENPKAAGVWTPRLVEVLLDDLERPDEAVFWCRALRPQGRASTLLLHARALFAAERVAEAERVLISIAESSRGVGDVWLARCRLRRRENVEQIRDALSGLQARFGTRAVYHRARAECLEESGGSGTEIRDALAEARRIDGEDRALRELLTRAHRDGGRSAAESLVAAARRHLLRADRGEAIRAARIAALLAADWDEPRELLEGLYDRPEDLFFRSAMRRQSGVRAPAEERRACVETLLGKAAAGTVSAATEPLSTRRDSYDAPSATPRVSFVDISQPSGVDFVHVAGSEEKDYILEINGGGVALLDFDGDERLDIFLVNGSWLPPPFGRARAGPPPSDRLYRNLGGLRFEDVTEKAGLIESSWGCGVAFGDYDNDGDPDLFVTNWGPDRLWRNDGRGRFEDVSERAGVDDERWGASAAFFDYDRDGYLDLFVVNYLDFDPRRVRRRGSDRLCTLGGSPVACGPNGLPPAPCSLYRNRGDGTFEDVSDSSGVRSVDLEHATYGLGVALVDADTDGWIDLYVANDTRGNLLFRNGGDGTFDEVGTASGVAFNDDGNAQSGMGTDAVFLRGSDLEDLFVVNFSDDTNTYYRNDGRGFFSEATEELGLAEPSRADLGWGTFFFDADLDGDQDLFVANGHVAPQVDLSRSPSSYRQANRLLLNDGRVFRPAAATDGLALEKVSRGAAFGDLDGDGDADVVINELGGRATVLENQLESASHWLAVRPRGTTSNRDAIGAVVVLETATGVQRRRIRSGSSYASQSELAARFGLGEDGEVRELRVVWPNASEEVFSVDRVDRVVDVVEGNGLRAPLPGDRE